MSVVRLTADQLTERRGQILAVTCVSSFMMALGASIIAVAIPAVSADLHLSFGAAIWVQAAYTVTMAVTMIPLGRLADQRGRFRFFLLALLVYLVAALLSGLSMTGPWLLSARILQGAAGGLAITTATALIAAVYPPGQRGRAMGLQIMCVYIGSSTGPTVSGLLVDSVGWRWIFFVNIPAGIAVLIWATLLRPRDERPATTSKPDPLGALFLAVFLIALLVPMTLGAQWGWTSARTIVSLSVSVLGLAGLVITELRVKDPMLDLDLLRHNRLFVSANLAALLTYTALFATTILTAMYLEIVQGRSAAITGVSMIAAPITQAVLAPLAGRWSDRVGSRLLTSGGMLSSAVGLAVLATLTETSPLGQVIVGLVLTSVGIGLFSTPNNAAIVSCVPVRQVGLASGFMNTMRTTGQALSMGVLGGIAASALGPIGGRIIFMHASTGHMSRHAVDGYARGYSWAMWTAMGLALVSAAASLTRGTSPEQAREESAPAATQTEDASAMPAAGSQGPAASAP
jgi:EmrB/QacA subfamily drug resistance transporter